VRKDWESGVHSSHLKDDFILSLPQLLVPLSNLQDLASYLEEWLDDPFEFHHDLINDRKQKLSLSFRFEKGHSVLKKYKPWCAIDFRTACLSGHFQFITDQSCLRIFMEGLAEASREAAQRLTSQSRLPKER
jgi:hypothetical protein